MGTAIYYRHSLESDKADIDALIAICFGDRSCRGALDNLQGRYLLAFDHDRLIALTGLSDESELNGYEIDWTCVHPTYRCHGLITDMIRTCIQDCNDRIYCSCWKAPDRDTINLRNAMNTLGFHLLVPAYKTYNSEHMRVCRICVYYQKNVHTCKCCEDLYVRAETERSEI